MKELLRASWILFTVHLLRTVRAKRGLIAFLLAGMPVAVACLVRVASDYDDVNIEPMTLILLLLLTPVTPLVSLVLSSSVVAEEIEDRTITYLFTRPIPRAAILVGRWSAVAIPIVLLLGTSAWITATVLGGIELVDRGTGWMPDGFQVQFLGAAALGGIVYSALFASAGALFRWPMLMGLAYTFVVEGFLGVLPGSNQKLTVAYYLRSFLLSGYPEMRTGEFEEAILAVPLMEPGAAALRLALILLGILALGAWRFTRREYVLSA